MISRVRLEAHGPSMEAVNSTLSEAAARIKPLLSQPVYDGDYLIQRDNMEQSADQAPSVYQFKGRMVLHPNTAG